MSERGDLHDASGGAPRAVDLVFITCLPLIALFPALSRGYPDGHDWLFELVRVAEFRHALADGQVFPLWAPNLYFGFGSPIFLFYAPLYAAVSSAIMALGVGIEVATVFALLLFALAGSACAWKLGSELVPGELSATAGRVTAAFYLLSPYLLGDAFERNANAEFSALLLAPLPLWGVALVGRRPRAGAACIAVGLALVVFAHNLTALTVSAISLTLAAILYGSRDRLASLGTSIVALAFGIGLSAPFWLPAIGYAGEVRREDLTTGKFDFHNNFEPLASFLGGREFFAPGLLGTLLPAFLLVTLLLRRNARPALVRPLVASVALALASAALVSPLSIPAWESLPFLPLFQFPWRFCGPLALATAIGIGPAMCAWTGGRPPRVGRLVELLLLLLFVGSAVPRWVAFVPLPAEARRNAERALGPSSIRERGMPATVRDDYLPPGADRAEARALRGKAPAVLAVEGGARVIAERATGSRIELTVSATEPSRVVVSRWASPASRVTVDGRVVDTERAPNGCIAIPLPAGESVAVVEIAQPALRVRGLATGVAALLAGVILLARSRRGSLPRVA